MRKKFLSAVLALALLASLTVTVSAAKFTDDASVNYHEAVDVMTAIHVIDGYEDGSVKPEGKLTRGAAAKIICNMILGPDFASKLKADAAPYPDVPVDHVFAGYISYCKNEGIINGYEDGQFRPAGALTGNAFLKMLLGALGYDPEQEGYVGDGWTINVISRAMQLELMEGLSGSFDGTKQLTREEAMLYSFNTLSATMVEYEKKSSVSIGAVEVSGASRVKEVTRPATEQDYRGGTEASRGSTLQFCEKCFPKLTCDENTTDRAGRDSITWFYDKEEIGTYSKVSGKSKSIINSTDSTIQTLLVSKEFDFKTTQLKGDAKIYANGEEIGTYGDMGSTYIPKGASLEVFTGDGGNLEKIVVLYYTYAKIDAVEIPKGAAVERGASAAIRLVDLKGNAIGTTYYDEYSDDALILPGFDKETYTKDAVLAVALDPWDGKTIVDSYAAKKVTGTPTSGQRVTERSGRLYLGSVTVSGKTYQYAGYTPLFVSLVGMKNGDNVSFDQSYTIYLTKDNYVIALETSKDSTVGDLYYVTGTYNSNEQGDIFVYAQTVSLKDGAKKNLKLESKGNTLPGPTSGSFNSTVAGIYLMTDKKVGTICKANDGLYNAEEYHGKDDHSLTADTLSQDTKASDSRVHFTAAANNTYVDGESTPGSTVSEIFVTSATRCIAVDGRSTSIDVRKTNGFMSMRKAGVEKAYAVYADGSKTATVVLYAGDDLKTVADMSDVVYLSTRPTTKVNDKTYSAALYFMNNNTRAECLLDDDYERGFYTYSVDDEDVYTLTGYDALAPGGDVRDSGTEGYVLDAFIKENIDDMLYGNTQYFGGGVSLDDLDFSKAKIIDVRDIKDFEDDDYSDEIASVKALQSALEPQTSDVIADIYIRGGKITFISVQAMEGKPVRAAYVSVPTFTQELGIAATGYGEDDDFWLVVSNPQSEECVYTGYNIYVIGKVGSTQYVFNSQTDVKHSNKLIAGDIAVLDGKECLSAFKDPETGRVPAGEYRIVAWLTDAAGGKWGVDETVELDENGVFSVPVPAFDYALGFDSTAYGADGTLRVTVKNTQASDCGYMKYYVRVADFAGGEVVNTKSYVVKSGTLAAGNTEELNAGDCLFEFQDPETDKFPAGDYTISAWLVDASGATWGVTQDVTLDAAGSSTPI